ncbi:hypothetical protein [Corallococcus sp. AS-1-6]|uniref:hypothetical protein n=1 Tax=Corallococcus sp. AS-1-6 TaxID=2874599 RepID=UPI001CC072A8|nr:hypothetical protein [Corallococcus sp. AS-1-6]MBZ4373251.1 hypothetical protein [Corallococcus sp. AS-1-6]
MTSNKPYSVEFSIAAKDQLSRLPPAVETHLRTCLDVYAPVRAPVEGHGSGGTGVIKLGEHDAVLSIDNAARHVRVESVLPKL